MTEAAHIIRYEQRELHGNAWVAAVDAALPSNGRRKLVGKVLQDTGDYFAIRFPKLGVHIYRRMHERGLSTHGSPLWDRGVLVMVLR